MKQSPITLYIFSPQDRSGRVRWLCEELGLPYECRILSYRNGDTQTPEYLAMNPMAAVPVMQEGELTMFESAAICNYLAEKNGSALVPSIGSPTRAAYLQWSFFAVATLDAIASNFNAIYWMPEEQRPAHIQKTLEEFEPAARALEAGLGQDDYLVGNEFSLADILVSQNLYWLEDHALPKYPKLVAYLDRLKKRPAAIRSEIYKDS